MERASYKADLYQKPSFLISQPKTCSGLLNETVLLSTETYFTYICAATRTGAKCVIGGYFQALCMRTTEAKVRVGLGALAVRRCDKYQNVMCRLIFI